MRNSVYLTWISTAETSTSAASALFWWNRISAQILNFKNFGQKSTNVGLGEDGTDANNINLLPKWAYAENTFHRGKYHCMADLLFD